jgi:hypothetical protein
MAQPRSKRERLLEARMHAHRDAVREFLARAAAIDVDRWRTPRAEGKWTPAQETAHVILAYETLLRELRGGQGLALRATPLRRRFYRLIGLTSILWRGRIPVAARAPRETRPDDVTDPATTLLARLESLTGEFETDVTGAWRERPNARLTHHLFGTLSLDQAIRLMTVHTRHHAAFLPVRPAVPHATLT